MRNLASGKKERNVLNVDRVPRKMQAPRRCEMHAFMHSAKRKLKRISEVEVATVKVADRKARHVTESFRITRPYARVGEPRWINTRARDTKLRAQL